MKVYGLTGGSGTGKSTVAQALQQAGLVVIDADAVYRKLTQPNTPLVLEIGQAFPGAVQQGTLQRSVLASIVFQNPQQLKKLNAITHPAVLDEVMRLIDYYEEKGEEIVFFDAPALRESGAEKLCDAVIAVQASKKTRMQRIMKRDGISEDEALARIQAQKNDDFYASDAYVLENDGSSEKLAEGVEKFCNGFPEGVMAKKKNKLFRAMLILALLVGIYFAAREVGRQIFPLGYIDVLEEMSEQYDIPVSFFWPSLKQRVILTLMLCLMLMQKG